MSRFISTLLVAAALTGCVSEFDLIPVPEPQAEWTGSADREAPLTVDEVIADLAVLCPDDQVVAIELLDRGLLEEHEILDAFEPCGQDEPEQHPREWPGLEGS